MIKYLGSKRLLLPHIVEAVASLPRSETVLDLFSGTSRVGHTMKRLGRRVIANDHNAYAQTLARCYVQADREDVLEDAVRLIAEFNALPGRAGYFTETFCVRSRYIQPRNGERIDAIREAIAAKGLGPEIEAVVLVSLLEAADRVDSTTGVQMAYLKDWAPRARQDLELRTPDVLTRAPAGKGEAHGMDALEAAAAFEADVAYIDPPYNQHSYLGNYHVWESLVRWDKPGVYGVACKREDCRTRKSEFNSRRGAPGAFERLVCTLRVQSIIVSVSDEGYLSREEVEAVLGRRGRVSTRPIDFKRYVGAQIGIHNPRGERVGVPGPARNTEYLFVASVEDDGAAVAGSGRGADSGAPEVC
ncbi:MAG: DNA adenine methylase [Phycisphaeraceae bacterium]|nr:DNA adenine methylase [Phycisphaeraceae bacterium]